MNETVNPVDNKGYYLVVPPQRSHAYVDWAAFTRALLRRWWFLVFGGVVVALVGFVWGFYFEKTLYRATAIVAVDNAGAPDGGILSGQFAGLASIAGLNLPRLGQSRRPEYIAALTSRELIGKYITQKNLMPVLLPKAYEETQQGARARPLTLGETVTYFLEDVLTVTEDRRSGLLKIDVDWTDRTLAPTWLSEILTLANQTIRDDTVREARASLDFLRAQGARETLEAVRQSIARLMEAKLNEVMSANVQENFPFRMIDPPEVPFRGIWPPRLLLVAGGFLLGMFLFGLIVTLVNRHRVFKRNWDYPNA